MSLNPYSIGIWSAILVKVVCLMGYFVRLNPYCNGICSATYISFLYSNMVKLVLILIVMEYALLPNSMAQ